MMIPTADDLKTVTDMRENAVGLINSVIKKDRPTIIMHQKSPKVIMLSIKEYNKLVEMVEDHMDELIAMDLEKEPYDSKNYVSEEKALRQLGIKL